MDDDKLTASERAAFARLPRERAPGELLEERTVRALRARGTLGRAQGRSVAVNPWRLSFASVAALALICFGFLLGQRDTRSHGADQASTNQSSSAIRLVSEAGSAYLGSLDDLSQHLARATQDERAADRALAVKTLYEVAQTMLRVAPDDPVSVEILQALARQQDTSMNPTESQGKRTIVWF